MTAGRDHDFDFDDETRDGRQDRGPRDDHDPARHELMASSTPTGPERPEQTANTGTDAATGPVARPDADLSADADVDGRVVPDAETDTSPGDDADTGTATDTAAGVVPEADPGASADTGASVNTDAEAGPGADGAVVGGPEADTADSGGRAATTSGRKAPAEDDTAARAQDFRDGPDRAEGPDPAESPGAGTATASSPGSDPRRALGPGAGPGARPGPGAPSGPASDDEQPDGMSSEEEVLCRLLHDTVQGVRPSANALDHLRRAVPARRAHRRQALVGAAASLMLAVTAVPALIHTANTADSSAAAPAGDSAQHAGQGGKGDPDLGPTRGPGSKPSGGGESTGKDGKDDGSGTTVKPSQRPPGTDGGVADPPGTAAANVPDCVPAQLSQGAAEVGGADADGKVYGVFRVVNASQEGCSVSAPGTVTAAAQGSADPARVTAAVHSAGGPAGALPDAAAVTLVLSPGDGYVVRFGWVPESGTNGCGTSTDPAGGGGSTGAASGTGSETGEGGTTDDPTGSPPGSVAVTYTPPGGAAAASGEIANVCAGTVYYTPPMAA